MPVPAVYRPAAWPRLGLLAAGVLLLHCGLASHWQRATPPAVGPRDGRPVAITLLALPRPAALAAAPPVTDQSAAPAMAPAAPLPAARPDAPARAAVAAVARRVAASAAPAQLAAGPPDVQNGPDGLASADAAERPDPTGPTGATDPTSPAGPTGPNGLPDPTRPSGATGPPTTAAVAATTTAAAEPPPVYATLLPAPAVLHYLLQHHGRPGQAVLTWRQDGPRYALTFDARLDPPGGGPGTVAPALVEQASQGGLDAAGLAPERFTDRRRGRGWRAANFQRELGRISFSGPSVEYPAWPGAQDRLSWLVQLVAIQAAATLPLPEITLWVVDARGGAERWRFVAQGDVPVPTPWGPVPARHWQRQPDPQHRPDSQRVDIWLAPAVGHWPVQLRVTSLRTGDDTLWRLAAQPAPP